MPPGPSTTATTVGSGATVSMVSSASAVDSLGKVGAAAAAAVMATAHKKLFAFFWSRECLATAALDAAINFLCGGEWVR